ncbi:MAG TPA: FtsX-like permease family protein [Thermoleophilaceae bacterium]|nr:FtsX-like permease family protein [Thermoleophilaceae bacterium]
MRRVAIRGLLARPLRTVLTALAIILGVAMVSGTYVLTDTIEHAFNGIFTNSYKNTTAVIAGKQVVEESSSGAATVPASLLPKIRKLDGVEEAAGAIFSFEGTSDLAKLVGRDGKPLGGANQPSFGFGFNAGDSRFNPMSLTKGRWAAGPGQVVIDQNTAEDNGYGIGDRIGVSAQGPVEDFTVTGIAKLGDLASLGGATIAIFDVATAQRLLRKQGQFDSIFVAAGQGVPTAQLLDEIKPLLPASAEVKTGEQQARSNSKETKKFISFIQAFLLGFAGIALFVGSFVIYNTLSITVAQRTREFATLRTLGATRRQVMRSVLLEGFVVGLLASIVGLVLGLALAKGLSALFDALGLSLPQTGTVFKQRTIVVSLVLGTVITVVSTIAPARNATRVPPISAVREGAALPPTRVSRRSPIIGGVVLAVAVAVLLYASFADLKVGDALSFLGLGCLLLFVAASMNAARLVRPLAAFVGRPLRRFGGSAGQLAAENSTRNPARTARTAAALMIGLGLVALVATLGAGLRDSDRRSLERQVNADYVLTSKNGFDTFAPKATQAVASSTIVSLATSIREERAKVFGKGQRVDGVEPAIAKVLRMNWVEGSNATLAQLGSDGAVLEKDFAKDHHVGVGDSFQLTTPTGERISLRVVGIQTPRTIDKLDPLLAKIVIGRAAFDGAFPRGKDVIAFLKTPLGANVETTTTLHGTLDAFPDAKLLTKAGWVDDRSSGFNDLLNLLYVLLALSVIVSLFGMVNTLVLSVFERTREVGMLRAVGMTRRQVRRMVRQESVITALIGAALGLPLGVAVAALATHALSDEGVTFSLPVGSLVAFTIVAFVAGVVAAVVPARRAARLNVLEALAYE